MCQIIAVKYLDALELVDTSGAPDYPENTTTIAPLTPYDEWNGEKWVTDTEAQHGAAVDAAEAQRPLLIDTAMASISLIQLKLQAGRRPLQYQSATGAVLLLHLH